MRCRRLGTNNQRGFTLIELLVALAIIGVITSAISMVIYQTLTIPAQSRTHMTAVKQVENAIHWLSRDVQQAQEISTPGFPLTLTWVNWDNTVHQVTYTLENGELERANSASGGDPIVVARHIDSANTDCQFTDGIFTFTITATVSGFRPSTEIREGKILPRAAA